jgi:hypothetical protein
VDYKPGDFFLGVVDFLAVLVPGAALVFAVTPYAELIFGPGRLFPPITDTAIRWTAFVVVAYVAGHLIASVASSLLDPFYDRTYRNLRRLTSKDSKSGLFLRLLAPWKRLGAAWKLTDKDASDPLLSAARELRRKQLGELALGAHSKGLGESNMLMWAQSNVTLRSSAAATEIERYQANSKFFRSMTVVLFLLTVLTVLGETPSWRVGGRALLLVIVLILFCYRFMQLRWEATKRTYEYFLLLPLTKEALPNPNAKSANA